MSRLQSRIDFRPGHGGVRDYVWESFQTPRLQERALRYLNELHPVVERPEKPYKTQSRVRDLIRKKHTCYALRRALRYMKNKLDYNINCVGE